MQSLDNIMDFSKLSEYRENNRIEAKGARGGLPESIWETYSAFANTSGGIILMGVAENRKDKTFETVKLTDPHKLVAQFVEMVNLKRFASCNLLSDDDIEIININGDEIIAITVPPAPEELKPVYVGKNVYQGTYIRIGEGDFKLKPYEVQKMLNEKNKNFGG